VPHLVASANNSFEASPVIDTDQRFSTTFATPGSYDYFCALHPKMQGQVVVTRA
jgi:plastocyanin